jgi:hypothetical protein
MTRAGRPCAIAAVAAALVAFGVLSPGARADQSPPQMPAMPAPAQAQPSLAPFGDNVSLALEKASLRARGASDELIAKIDASPYRYFRLLGPLVSARTCFAFQDFRWRLPSVAVHGDAHLEQFVVTGKTFGMEDFDQAGFGPAIVDLVRYAASIHVACRKVAWKCDADQAVAAYFKAYRDALDRPGAAAAPAIVDRLRRGSPQDAAAWLSWVDSQIHALPADEEALYRRSWTRLVALLTEAQPNRPASEYEIQRLGRIEIGVGSALEKKILARTRGPSDSPADDLILEARLTTRPTGRECVWRPPHGGSLHVILFTSVLGRRMPDIYGFLPQEQDPTAPEWWVQSWESGYRELSLADLESQTDLDELAADAAYQLGGHFWKTFPEPLRQYLRFAQLRAFDLVEERARKLSRELADESVAGWERFRAGT